jgi:hypothetical protein
MILLFSSGMIGKILSSSGIRSNKKTHINCGLSARMAGIVCANEEYIRRQDRWNNTTMNDPYLTRLPREIMRPMADFPTNGRPFYLAHAGLIHLPDSAKSCCPRSTNSMTDTEFDNNNPIQPTVAANAFVQVIMMLRKTFIQDSVL